MTMKRRGKTNERMPTSDVLLPPQIARLVDAEVERKREGEALRVSAEIMNNLAEGVLLIRADGGVIVYSNSRFETMFGYEPGELVGRPVSILVAPGDERTEAIAAEIMRDLHKNGIWSGDILNVKKNGAIFWSRANISTFEHAEHGTVWISVHQEIDERKRIGEALRNVAEGVSAATGDEFFSSLVEHLARALDVRYAFISELADPGGRRLRLLALWSGSALSEPFEYDVAGTPCEHVIGKRLAHFPSGVSRRFPTDRWLRRAKIEGYMAIPLFGRSGEALGHMGVMHNRPLDEGMPAESVLKIFAARAAAELHRKLAEEERLHLEDQMMHAEKLKSLGVLAGGIAHDFNNLLTGILGNVSLAQDALPLRSPIRAKLERIEEATLRAAELTNQMLAYSGRARFDMRPLDLNRLAGEMIKLLEAVISKKAVLAREFARDLPSIDADATQIRQVLMNLITNASDALGGHSGSITVRTGVVEMTPGALELAHAVERLPAGTYVDLSVSDTGMGMDEATRERIFDPFFSTKFTGRGLGLAAVLGIVRGHRGAIEVKSAPGSGTTVKLLIPACEQRVEERAKEVCTRNGWRGEGTILVVDDEEIVRSAAGAILKEAGLDVLTASDGVQGLEIFRRNSDRVSAVLLDMTMPRMDGATTLARLRALRPAVPIILMSGYSEQDATSSLDGDELAGFIQKPYRPDDLIHAVRTALKS
jgi:PAS domain S-box-containing protein